MRVNLITESLSSHFQGAASCPISLTIRPACGLPGDYKFPTDTASLLKMLHQQTDLPATVLERFKNNLSVSKNARLLGVELSERVLTNLGYFVD